MRPGDRWMLAASVFFRDQAVFVLGQYGHTLPPTVRAKLERSHMDYEYVIEQLLERELGKNRATLA